MGEAESAILKIMKLAEWMFEKADLEDISRADDERGMQVSAGDLRRIARRLNNSLLFRCRDDVISAVRGADGQGVLGWQKLYRKFNPRTMGRALALMAVATSPDKVKDITQVDSAVRASRFPAVC